MTTTELTTSTGFDVAWAERAARDPAAEKVREVFAALADVLEDDANLEFDRPRTRWDTRKRWRS